MNGFWQGVLVGCGVWGLVFWALVMAIAIVKKGKS